MNVTDLQYLLQHPDALVNADKTMVEQLARDYPYFQTAYLLMAKKSQLQHESSFESKLNLAAAYSIDRVKLYELLQQAPTTFSRENAGVNSMVEKVPPPVSPASSDAELDLLLKSIHDRKQQILGTVEQSPAHAENIFDGFEPAFLEDLKGAGSEFSPVAMEFSEGEPIDAGIEAAELDVIKELEYEIEEQVAFDLNEEFLALNETAGDGEYVPLHELLEEEEENAFVEEQDPEVESISVIEEEFVLRDLDQDLKLFELENISSAENYLQLEPENNGATEIPGDPELQSWKEMEQQLQQQENADRQEELEIINAKAGGGSEFSFLELDEEAAPNETFELATESASVRQLESISTEEPLIPVRKEEKIIMEETSSLRFNETVTVPGAFLPGKSYSFLDWLKFFKPENSGGTAKKEEKVPEPVETGLPAVDKTEHSGPVKTGLTAELETIDRIVSTIRHERSDKAELLFSPADLARKSIEMDDEMVTETLASIYEAQGLYDKAIRMYARLSLKFPEKSLFFAARIKELKSKK